MKRDMELCRTILLTLADKTTPGPFLNLAIPDYSKEQIAYNCHLLYQAGLVAAYKPLSGDNKLDTFAVGDLTWAGNDFIESIREPSQWEKVKDFAREKGATLTIDVIKSIASHLAIVSLGF